MSYAVQIAAVDCFIEEVTEATEDLIKSADAEFAVGVEGQSVAETLRGHPTNESGALLAHERSCLHGTSVF